MDPKRERIIAALRKAMVTAAADEGHVVGLGWIACRAYVVPPLTSVEFADACYTAYMAGAQHLFSCIMDFLDPGDEPTEADLARMERVSDELAAWARGETLRTTPAGGHA